MMTMVEEHVEETNSSQFIAVKTIDKSVLDNFKNLTNDDELKRLNSSVYLLQYFTKIQDESKKQKELNYALKRLIRGLGASTTASRSGFFTTFVAFLKLFLFNEIDLKSVLQICKKELKVGKTLSNKEDADAVVGQILTCGAILRSNKIQDIESDDLDAIIKILITSSRHRTYHDSLAYSFIVEFIEKVDDNKFANSIWPRLEPELIKTWDKQTINTINCLIVAATKFPNVLTKKFFKNHFNGSDLLNPSTARGLFKLFWENSTTSIVSHPAFENFSKYIANCDYLEEFWTKFIDSKLVSANKLIEIETLKIITDILQSDKKLSTKLSSLLTENFVKMMMKSLKSNKLKKDEILKACYDDFFEALVKYCSKLNTTDNESNGEIVKIIKKLILHPGILNIEKYTSNRIIHQIIVYLKESEVKQLFEIYKSIFLNTLQKNANDKSDSWLNYERQNAGYMLQNLVNHKNIQDIKWKTEQLKFMLKTALFHTNQNGDIIKGLNSEEENKLKKDNIEEMNLLSNELSLQMRNIFYISLQLKFLKLQDQKNILLELTNACNEILQKKNHNKYLKQKIDENILKTWKEMYAEVQEKHIDENREKTSKKKHKNSNTDSNDNNLELVFHILLLHMGLQLFKEPEMAQNSIYDLKKCIKKSKIHKNSNEEINQDEPEWIEVVVDLFLHLLSQNVSTLRTIVDSVFPHLCDKLTLTAIHQIIEVLDMKNENDLLSEKTNENDKNVEESSNDDSEEDIENEEKEEDDDDDDDDDEEIIEEEEEEENTATDVLRNAVSQALGSVGHNNKNDDQESVDLDDMDEEEGKRLDEALSNAFRALRNTTNSKKTKEYRVKTTTLMHFRIRVLDLIEIIIQYNPNMLITIEIMLALFNMIEFCTDDEQKSLLLKLEKVLNKLTALKHLQFNLNEITSKNICDYFRLIIEKKVKVSDSLIHNTFKTKCCTFLISCEKLLFDAQHESSKTKESNSEILNLITEYLKDFIESRNPRVNVVLLNELLKTRWHGMWQIVIILTNDGIKQTTRTFRRMQIFNLLETFYNNHEFIRQNHKLAEKSFKIIETNLQNYLNTFVQQNTINNRISIREFLTILDVFYAMKKCHDQIKIDTFINKDEICNSIQTLRKQIKLDNPRSYLRFCNVFNLKALKNSEIKCNEKIDNNLSKDNEINNAIDVDQEEINTNLKKKRKNHENFRKEKKIKKAKRMEISSEGLNGGISFANTISSDIEMSEE